MPHERRMIAPIPPIGKRPGTISSRRTPRSSRVRRCLPGTRPRPWARDLRTNCLPSSAAQRARAREQHPISVLATARPPADDHEADLDQLSSLLTTSHTSLHVPLAVGPKTISQVNWFGVGFPLIARYAARQVAPKDGPPPVYQWTTSSPSPAHRDRTGDRAPYPPRSVLGLVRGTRVRPCTPRERLPRPGDENSCRCSAPVETTRRLRAAQRKLGRRIERTRTATRRLHGLTAWPSRSGFGPNPSRRRQGSYELSHRLCPGRPARPQDPPRQGSTTARAGIAGREAAGQTVDFTFVGLPKMKSPEADLKRVPNTPSLHSNGRRPRQGCA